MSEFFQVNNVTFSCPVSQKSDSYGTTLCGQCDVSLGDFF